MSLESLCSKVKRAIGAFLVVSLVSTSAAFASPKPIPPEVVHKKIVKLGAGNWVWVEETNGITLHGILTRIDANTFGIQLYNDPASVTPVAYSDVLRMRTPASGKAILFTMLAVVGAGVGGGLILHHEYETHKNQMPTFPTQ